MTERGVTPGAAGPVAARQPDSTAWVSPSDCPFEPLPLTAPDHVPTVLRHPPATDTTADPHPRIAAADPVARRLAELTAGTPPAFDVPTPGGSSAVTLAAHCPDLFLISAAADRRAELVAELSATAASAGQRVLVLANQPDAVLTALAGRCGVALGRAVGLGENVVGHGECHVAHGQRHRDGLRTGLTDRVASLSARINVEERREKLQAEVDRLTADLGRVDELTAAAVDASDELKRLVEARDAGVAAVAAHAARRAEAEQELAALKQSATQPVGFFKKLFGGAGKPEPAKVEAAEVKLRELAATAPPDPHAAFTAARNELIAVRTVTLRADLEAKLTAVRGELAHLPPAEPLDDLCRAFDAATADLAQLDAHPFSPPAAELNAVRLVVGPPAAVGHDPFLSDAHPEVEPRFDRIVWADAEDLTDDAFAAVARLGASWVLVGTPDPLHPPGFRNGRPRAAFFSRWWERLHAAGWTYEDGRPLVRLVSVERRADLHCEPLLDRADIEARWVTQDGEPVLAEVLFPAEMPHAEAKRFLAHEADEVRCGGFGPCEWEESGEWIRCRWPAVDAATGDRSDVDLGYGVCEHLVNGTTASVTFDATAWTRDSAARWLSERLLPPTRTAIA